MAWSVVQSNSKAATATAVSSVALAYASANLTSGTKLIAVVTTSTQTGATDTVSTVKDGAGNSFTLIGRKSQGSPNILCDVSLWAIDTPSADAGTKPTITATLSGGTANMGILIQEVSGLLAGNTTAMADGTLKSLGGNGGSSTGSPAYSSTASNEYLVSVYGDDGGPETWVAPAGLTADAKSLNSQADSNTALAYGNSTGGTEAGSWGLSGSAADWGTLLVAFRLASTTITGSFSLAMAPRALAVTGTYTPPAITGTFSLTIAPRALAFTGSPPVTGTFSLVMAARALALAGTAAPPAITGSFSLALAPRALAFSQPASLIVSIASRAGTDDYGNAFPQGLEVFHGQITGQMVAGGDAGAQIIMKTEAGEGALIVPTNDSLEDTVANLTSLVVGSGAAKVLELLLSGPQANVAGATDSAQIEMASSNAGATASAAMYFNYADAGGGVTAHAYCGIGGFTIQQGSITAVKPGSSPAVAEIWHSLGTGPGATWTINQARYRMTAEGELEIDIALNAQTGGGAAGTFTWTTTLPAAYQFAGNYARAYPLGYNGTVTSGAAAGCVLIDGAGTATAGRVRIQLPALIATTNVGITIRIPLS